MSLNAYYNQEPEADIVQINGHSFNAAFKDALELTAPGVICPDLISAGALQSKHFPPLQYVIEGLVSPGLTIVAGKPKEGKSWLVLGWACAVAEGSVAMGNVQSTAGDVLYLALEDNQRRLQSRTEKLGPGTVWPDNLQIATEWPRFDQGGLEALEAWRQTAEDPRMVVVDVFAKVRAQKGSGDSGYDADYAAAAPLQKWAVENGIAVVAIHHTRKMGADDPLEAVSGTNGLTGAADATMVLKRESINSGDAVLYARGRDIPETELALSFSDATCRWEALGVAWEYRRSEEKREIIGVLETLDCPASISEIASHFPDVSEATIRQRLKRMVDAGEIKRSGRGQYTPVTTVTMSQEGGGHVPL